MSLAYRIYRAGAPWAARAAGLARPFLGAEERRLWPEREGRVAAPPAAAWIHAASMGEAGGVRPLVAALRAAAPGAALHLTATTRTGRARLSDLGDAVSLAPFDAPEPLRRFLERVRPARVLIVETEVWPWWLEVAAARGIPVAFVSARLSARSLRGYRRLGRPLARLMAGVAGVLAQTDADAARWRELGVPAARVRVSGNLKDDGLPTPADRPAARAALGLDPARPLLVFGSLRPGEPAALAPVWQGLAADVRSRWQVAVVPRHPRAEARLRREARAAGLPDGAPWRWDARLGVLRDYWRACDVAVVGGSFAPYGGHHPLEPAATGAAVAIGPHHETQADSIARLVAHGALPADPSLDAARAHLASLLGDGTARAAAMRSALAAAEAARGATARTLDALREWAFWPPR